LISDKACSSEELIDEADEAGRGRRILSILIQEGLFCETDGMISFSETR
jgi:hypothetical protein